MKRRHPKTPQRVRVRMLVTVLLVLAVFMVARAKEPKPPEKPDPIKVVVTPKLGLSPLLVTVSVYVFQGDPAWTCPAVRIVWPDLTKSEGGSDCDPDDPVFDTFTRTALLGPGRNEITVYIEQGKESRVERRTVEVW